MKVSYFVSIAAMLGLLTGCGIQSPSQLTKPPKQEQSMQDIMRAVNQYIPKGAQLTIPSQSQEKSAIYQVDLDGDGSNEIVTFYQNTSSSDAQNGMLVLKREGNSWTKLADCKGLASDVKQAEFQDVNGDSFPDIIVGWGYAEGTDGEVAVYSYQKQQLSTIWSHPYSALGIGDVDGDHKAEILVIEHNHDQLTAEGRLYSYAGSEMKESQHIPLDGSVNGFSQVVIGKATPDQLGIFIDADVGAHSAMTSLLMLKKGKLVDVLADESAQQLAYKEYPLYSQDVNHDGIVEIGTLTAPPGTEDLSMADTPWVQSWYQLNPDLGSKMKFKLVQENYANYGFGFDFTIPTNWQGKYTIVRKRTEQQEDIQFLYLAHSAKPEAPLLTLHLIKRENWSREQKQYPHAIVLGENNGRMIVGELPTKAPALSAEESAAYQQLQLDEAKLRQAFRTFHL
ncbi:FG-GAP repeat domain-containing protein [Brevibacillus ginsengisoli]|uniref:FG-GAP repeat domain-containing protein n=1 Tax=Brevibacillus ginsengisoli TaxID=363854 RepID=UPI003CF04778